MKLWESKDGRILAAKATLHVDRHNHEPLALETLQDFRTIYDNMILSG